MPNMFGGDQFHPAYNPSVKVARNQMLLGDALWTIDIVRGVAELERIDGTGETYAIDSWMVPKQVKAKYKRLLK